MNAKSRKRVRVMIQRPPSKFLVRKMNMTDRRRLMALKIGHPVGKKYQSPLSLSSRS